jgi:hypothetical protein
VGVSLVARVGLSNIGEGRYGGVAGQCPSSSQGFPPYKAREADGRATHSRCERVHSPSWDEVEVSLWGICIGDLATEAMSWQATFLMPVQKSKKGTKITA